MFSQPSDKFIKTKSVYEDHLQKERMKSGGMMFSAPKRGPTEEKAQTFACTLHRHHIHTLLTLPALHA